MKILGIRKFKSKEGKPCCIVSVERSYTNFESDNSDVCVGFASDSIWLPASCADKVTAKDIGKNLILESTYANNKMYVHDVTVA